MAGKPPWRPFLASSCLIFKMTVVDLTHRALQVNRILAVIALLAIAMNMLVPSVRCKDLRKPG